MACVYVAYLSMVRALNGNLKRKMYSLLVFRYKQFCCMYSVQQEARNYLCLVIFILSSLV
jgi:hypothetical protein